MNFTLSEVKDMPSDVFLRLTDEKKNRIIESAKEEFNSKGFEKATVVRICELAGIPRITFYSYFDSLDDIYNYIYNNQSSECSRVFNDNNIVSGIRDSQFDMETFLEFEAYYLKMVASKYGLKKLYNTINNKPIEERLILNLLISLFTQYELGIMSRTALIYEFNSFIKQLNT
ncbi:hypothetical protein CCE28_07235 [Anaeromicrobium sediminis]|uniref:HTH tetR-type domain-containing protein n=2 Tax=Anaeromicrobium sediminis TaxID=1478221 RepID=A0A267MKU5_9FIRM|nr:hypothetical protein CCE28_07235 [Anaeromicrobium sediminis]